MVKPRLLDLFCGAGGASMGYYRAGFEVVGVDISPQPRYPFAFRQADAMTYPLDGFDAYHASPPCQAFTKYRNVRPDLPSRYSDLIAGVRGRFKDKVRFWVIENVAGAPLLNPFKLCGSHFGLDVQRHRYFESSFSPPVLSCDHSVWEPNRFPGGRSRERGHARVKCRGTVEVGRWNIPLKIQQEAMGIDWMELEELSEAIPPTYTEYIGAYLLSLIDGLLTNQLKYDTII